MIRALGVDDLEALTALESRSQPIPWTEDQLLLELVNDDAVVFGSFDPVTGLAGHVCTRVMVDELWILNLAVEPKERRHGVGRALLDRARLRALEKHCASLWLEVRASNDDARRLYDRFGFIVRGERPRYYPPIPPSTEREMAILMSLAITTASADRRGT
jgi:ribosomal-protein-alanine N-acetyltransferase